MATQRVPPSVPPPSYPPPPVTSDSRGSSPSLLSGWRPADDDDGPAAVAWRARTSLRRADRALTALGELNANVAKLNATIEAWSVTWGRHWSALVKLMWAVGVPVLIAALVSAVTAAWRWASTLHH